MKKNPFFSIILPTYNREKFIDKGISSVIKQEFTDWELIIIDDGSTDNTKDIVTNFRDERIKYFYQKNQERSIARNNGIKKSQGKFVCFLDSDDYYMPNHLLILFNLIGKHHYAMGLYYTGTLMEYKNKINNSNIPDYNLDKYNSPIQYVFNHLIMTNSVCVEKMIFNEFIFIPKMNVFQDIHLWIRILTKYPFFYSGTRTTVCVDHQTRGGRMMSANIDMKRIKEYFSNIDDLFNNHNLEKYISKQSKKEFYLKRYLNYAFLSIWHYEFSKFRFFFFKILKYEKFLIFREKYFKLMKEFLTYVLKKRLQKKEQA